MRRHLLIALVVFCALATFFIAYAKLAAERREEITKHNGDTIVKAIHNFHINNGIYPSDVNELIPKYLAEIPQPTMGRGKWSYRRYESREGFYLREVPKFGDRVAFIYEDPNGWDAEIIDD